VRKSFLQNFLMEHNLELIVWHWYERMQLRDDYHKGQHLYVESSVMRLGADMKIPRAPRSGQNETWSDWQSHPHREVRCPQCLPL
jgi:hypothetical protein